jgi:hypothetical protein
MGSVPFGTVSSLLTPLLKVQRAGFYSCRNDQQFHPRADRSFSQSRDSAFEPDVSVLACLLVLFSCKDLPYEILGVCVLYA